MRRTPPTSEGRDSGPDGPLPTTSSVQTPVPVVLTVPEWEVGASNLTLPSGPGLWDHSWDRNRVGRRGSVSRGRVRGVLPQV